MLKKIIVVLLMLVMVLNIQAKAISVVVRDEKVVGVYYTQDEMFELYGADYVFDEIVMINNQEYYLEYNLGLSDGVNYALLDEDSVNKCSISNKIVENMDKFSLSCNCNTESKTDLDFKNKQTISIKQSSDIKYMWVIIGVLTGLTVGYLGGRFLK